jgi:glycosyltransferase involved in cell wall biosynthesis
MRPTIKLLCVIEGTTVNGPAKNLLNFCRLAQSSYFQDAGLPRVEVSIVTFHRLGGGAEENGHGRQRQDRAPNSLVAAAREERVDVQVINERFRFDPQVIPALRRIVAKESPDVIQTHMIKSHFLVKLAGLGKQYPWVAYHHGYTTTDLKMRAYNRLNHWSLPSAARVITVCQAFANQLSRAGVRADRITVCHNSVVAPACVPSEERQTLKHRLGITGGELVVLSVGRLSREKGYSDLLNAIALLRELDSELKFKLVIAGEGPERERLERAAHRSRLSARVLFIGHVEDITPYYAIADTLALPSHSEGSPNVLLEAMAAGVPVVATNVGGVPEIAIAEKSALLVPPREPRLFAAALHRLLTTPELAQTLSANAKVRVETHFSPESHAQSLIRIYQELLPIRAELAEAQPVSI